MTDQGFEDKGWMSAWADMMRPDDYRRARDSYVASAVMAVRLACNHAEKASSGPDATDDDRARFEYLSDLWSRMDKP